MKIIKSALASLLSFLMLLFCGCSKKHILDGPGMINNQPWKAFTLSRSDSYSQYNFWFTVEESEYGFKLTGQCRGEDGTLYTLEEGVALSIDDLKYLRGLWLGDLPDAVPDAGDDDPILLDAPIITLTLTWTNGTEQKKAIGGDLSIQIYQRFLPYFINH